MKIFLLLGFVIFIIALSAMSSVLISKPEGNNYLTPIPESTWSVYRQKRPIDNKFDAVLEATQQIHYWRLNFTQGAPKVVFTKEMTLIETIKLIPKDPYGVSAESRGDDTKVWLVIFKGQWQVQPPTSNDLIPLESGCIYVILDANDPGYTQLRATSCQTMP